MTNLIETPVYETGIFQLETTTPVIGGQPAIVSGAPVAGHSNAQALQLANRTSYLNGKFGDLANSTDPTKGASLVYGTTKKIDTVVALRAYVGTYDGQCVNLVSYTSGWAIVANDPFPAGGGLVYWDTTSTQADNSATVFQVTGVTTGRWKRRLSGELSVEECGATNGTTLVAAFDIALAALPVNGGGITFNRDYSGITGHLRVLRSKTKIRGIGKKRLTFNSGFGLRIGFADFAAPNKNTSTKVVDIVIESLHITGITDYAGDLTHIEFADNVVTRDFTSSPINISSASLSQCVGIKLSWVQWYSDYAGFFGGNKAGVYLNYTNHGIDNEDHIHWFGSTVILQKGLITGVAAASIYVKFANGRGQGASEVSMNGVHLSEFGTGDKANVYGLVIDLDGNTTDKKVFRSFSFIDCMFEAQKTMIDTATLNATAAGKDVSSYVFNGVYFVGNSFVTQYLMRGDNFKSFATFRDCEVSSIDTLFDNVRCRFEGYNDFTPFNTFSTLSLTSHDFVGMRPVAAVRTRRKNSQSLGSGMTTMTIAHGLAATPNFINLNVPYNSTWFVTSKDATNVVVGFGTAPGSSVTIDFVVSIESSQ